MGIYVEIRIRGPMEELWCRTQEPALHERWDLRFSGIDYLPRESPEEPQRFLYTTHIGFGLKILGAGESVGSRDGTRGEHASALRFWSDDPRSLIREGRGYWKYIPTEDGIRFLTWYDYQTRFGWLGRLFDRLLFRPLMGWATAWSFDRLRLWIEQGLDPTLAVERAVIHALARLSLAFIFLYHGLVPKLLLWHPGEVELMTRSGVPMPLVVPAIALLATGELLLALGLLLFWHSRWPLVLVAVGIVGLTLPVLLHSPTTLGAPFNPVTLNLAVLILALVGLLVSHDLPSAARCLRHRPGGEE